jgi:hypothetical protein
MLLPSVRLPEPLVTPRQVVPVLVATAFHAFRIDEESRVLVQLLVVLTNSHNVVPDLAASQSLSAGSTSVAPALPRKCALDGTVDPETVRRLSAPAEDVPVKCAAWTTEA